MSPTILERYLTAGRKVSEVALGGLESPTVEADTFSPPRAQRQDIQIDELPTGTRGGVVTQTNIPVSG